MAIAADGKVRARIDEYGAEEAWVFGIRVSRYWVGLVG